MSNTKQAGSGARRARSISRALAIGAALLCTASCGYNIVFEAPPEEEAMESTQTRASAQPKSAGEIAVTPPGRAFPYEIHRARLANGLRVVMVPMPADGLVSYWSIVRTGSRDEVEPGVTGFAHFFEHMMFRGTKRLPGDAYDKIVNGMGADANAYTTDDYTAYHLSFGAADLPTVIDIEADRFQNLEYDENAFKTEAGAVAGEYRKGRTNPFEVLFEALQDTAFDAHTYKHTTIGFLADVLAMPQQYAYSKTFFARFYRPENVVLLVAGDIQPKSVLADVQKHYGAWKPGYQEPAVPVEPPQRAQRRVAVPFDGQTLPLLAVAFKGERLLTDDRAMIAATVAGDLAFGPTSPLYKKLVLDEQRVDGLFSSFGYNRDPGLWGVYARVKDPADIAAIEGEIWRALDELRRAPVEAARLDAVRSRAKYELLSDLATPAQVCSRMASIVALTGDLAAVEEIQATLDQVDAEDVRAAAARWLVPEGSTVAVLHAANEPLAAPKTAEPPVLLPVAQDPNVAFKLWFKVGSQDDPPGKEGLAALVAGLIDGGGTRSRPYDEILAALYPLAAGYSVSVDKEMSVVSGLVHRDQLAAFYPILVEALLQPGFRAEDFERLRSRAITGIEKTMRYSSDEELGKASLYATLFAGTRYAHLEDGALAALRSLTVEDARAFYERHYTRDNLVIGLGGSYPESLPAQLAADLARLPAGKPEPAAVSSARRPSGREVVLVEKPGDSVAISFGYPIDVRRGSREFYALWIANSWLGEHRNSSSHLYQVIREERGLNYGDYSYIEAYPDGGRRTNPPTGVGRRSQLFEVWIRPVKREHAVFALRAALREVEDLATGGMTREEFDFTRKFLKSYSLHFAETLAEKLGYAIDDRYFGLEQPHLATFRRMMDEITLEEVNAAVKKHLRANDLAIAMVTAEAASLRDALVSNAPSPISYGEIEVAPAILAADREISVYPLGISAENVRIVPVDSMFAE